MTQAYAERPLTDFDIAALRCFADGLGAKETAARLQISEQTVKDRLLRARIKLHAKNTTHAVAIAVRKGLI